MGTVRFAGVPPEMSTHDIVRAASQQTGFVAAACPRPPPGSAQREVLTRFASRDAATFAVAALRGMEFEGRRVFGEVVVPAKDLEIVVVPAITSDSACINADVDLSAIVIRKLDSLLGVPGDVTNALLDRTSESRESQLDLQVTYLRRVHHFCFYSALWCDDEWDLRRRCGAVVVRDVLAEEDAQDPKKEQEEVAWRHDRNQRLKHFLENVRFERPTEPNIDEEPWRGLAVNVSVANTRIVDEHVFQCTECKMLFSSTSLVHKHHAVAHPSMFEAVRRTAVVQSAMAAYLADTNPPDTFRSRA